MTQAPTFNAVAYSRLEICNPVSPATLDRVLAQAELRPGDTAIDLGCGTGFVARRLATRLGLEVFAVERDPAMAALAERTFAEGCAPGGARVLAGEAAEVLEGLEPVRLMLVLGATDAAEPGLRDLTETLRRLAAHVAPGGWLLWGDAFWRRAPSAALKAAVEATNSYLDFPGVVAAGEAAGLALSHAAESPPDDHEHMMAAMTGAIDDWVAAHPEAPEAAGFRRRMDAIRGAWLAEAREALGFGLWLFRKG
ncbi:MAG TPA: methyltransferase domain-containing protein [Caulobacteraceae bacterium]